MIPSPSNRVTFTVYGADYCPWTTRAKAILSKLLELGIIKNWKYVNIQDYSSDEYDNLRKKYGVYNHTTIPLIFYENMYLGGYEQLWYVVTGKQFQ
jgi:glutaredoxin